MASATDANAPMAAIYQIQSTCYLTSFFLVTILAQAFFPLVCSDLMPLSLTTTWHMQLSSLNSLIKILHTPTNTVRAQIDAFQLFLKDSVSKNAKQRTLLPYSAANESEGTLPGR